MAHIEDHISPPKPTAIVRKSDEIQGKFELSSKPDRKKYSFKLHFPANNETLFIRQNRRDRITVWNDLNDNDKLDPVGINGDQKIMNTDLVDTNFVPPGTDTADLWGGDIIKPKKVRKEMNAATKIKPYLKTWGTSNVQNLKKENFFDIFEDVVEIGIDISARRRLPNVGTGGATTYPADAGIYFRLYISKGNSLSAWFNTYFPTTYTGVENHSEPTQ